MSMISTGALLPVENVETRILAIRDQRVIRDSDPAALYGVPTHRLNEQVQRNPERIPEAFRFQLTDQEVAGLRSQFAILKPGRGQHRKYLPYAFFQTLDDMMNPADPPARRTIGFHTRGPDEQGRHAPGGHRQ